LVNSLKGELVCTHISAINVELKQGYFPSLSAFVKKYLPVRVKYNSLYYSVPHSNETLILILIPFASRITTNMSQKIKHLFQHIVCHS